MTRFLLLSHHEARRFRWIAAILPALFPSLSVSRGGIAIATGSVEGIDCSKTVVAACSKRGKLDHDGGNRRAGKR